MTFNHLGTTILVTSHWFCDSNKNCHLFLSTLDLAAECLPRVQGLSGVRSWSGIAAGSSGQDRVSAVAELPRPNVLNPF